MRGVKIILFFLLTGVVELQAQTNFVKGYYITNAQDTVHGYIEDRGEDRNYRICVFKQDFNSATVGFLPKDISGFALENKEFYEAHTFKNREGEELYGFFKVLLVSDLSLLQYRSRFFARRGHGEPVEVSKQEELVEGAVKRNYVGLGTLRAFIKDCPQVAEDVLKKKPNNGKSYKATFEAYYACSGSAWSATQPVRIKPHFEFGLLGSAGVTNLKWGGKLSDVNMGSQTTYGGGAFASVFLPKVDERFRVVIEALYTRYKNYTYFPVATDNTNNDLYVDYSALKLPLLGRFGGRIYFFELGVQNQFIFSQDFRWRIETVTPKEVFTREGTVSPMNKWGGGYLVGAGVKCRLAEHLLRSSVRFSDIRTTDGEQKFQSIELLLSVQINR